MRVDTVGNRATLVAAAMQMSRAHAAVVVAQAVLGHGGLAGLCAGAALPAGRHLSY